MNETPHDTRLFAELYDAHPQAIVWLRPVLSADGKNIDDFEFAYCNDEGLKYLNLTPELLRGLRVSNSPTLTDDLRKQVMAEMIRVYQTGVKSESTFYNPALNKYARILRTKLRDGVLTVVQDITEENHIINELKQKTLDLAETTREMQEQKLLLDKVLANSSNGISVSRVFRDDTGKVVDALTIMANDAAVRFIGFPREVYLSKRATEIEPAVIDSPYYQACIQTLQTGVPFVMQYPMQSTGRWLELAVSKLDYDHLIQIFTDVTSIKESQLRQEQAAERLQAVFDSAQSGMFIFEPIFDESGDVIDFRFVLTNPMFAAYVGQTPAVLKGELGSKFFPGYLHNGVFDMYKQTYLTGQAQRRDVHYNVDEHDLYLDLLSTKVHDEVLVTFTDHTQVKKAQLQLEKVVFDLQRSNQNLEEFAHAASHDLKEPIRKISVFSSRLQTSLQERLTEFEQSLFTRIQNASERMMLLVEDLLAYSHVSTTLMAAEEVDLNKKFQSILTDLEVEIEEKNAVIRIEPLPVVKGYRRQLQQLFQNLLSYALKYHKPGRPPVITVRSLAIDEANMPAKFSEEGGNRRFHLIEIADEGIGFDMQYAQQIFQLFYRLHGRVEYNGTGIGLSIARKVAENHHGFIWAESEPGKGTSFKVLLPS
jgi:signal transduction histidine kinase